ncbi:MAG TPA: hypothetical protein DEF18_12180 [Muricauda sp.]|uniref:DUF6268 domain-containing protein n=1 Tax=Flagellimonas aurea TaxID=2915619 RepID=A0ABS3G372_9FLAO|nr:hypothetical protein [Allomuricauda sp.]MBC71389.1 hypothetical protein [Allomuricauda sp.]MBO0353758.1 hypothetical protein [Allomuricauda aurea]HBU78850.1 hypothetical protein [Allomuricauda sp.]
MKKSSHHTTIWKWFAFVVILCSQGLLAQSTDILRLEYLNIPENESGVKTQRYKALLNVPIKLNEKDEYLAIGGEYNRFDMGYTADLPFDKKEMIRFHIIDFNLGLIKKWNEDWNLVTILTPRIASNLLDGIIKEDFFMNASAAFWKEKPKADKPFRIVLGLTYNSTAGVPVPLPLIHYYRRFHPDWSFVLGVPKSNLKYHLDKRHSFELASFLDGYFMNLQNDIVLDNGSVASRISFNTLVGSLGYQYNVTESISFFAIAGTTLIQEGKLRNKERGEVFLFNKDPNFYIRTGFKIGIF